MRRYIAGVLVFLRLVKRPVPAFPERQARLRSHLVLHGSSSPWSARVYHPICSLSQAERKTAPALEYLHCFLQKVKFFAKTHLRLDGVGFAVVNDGASSGLRRRYRCVNCSL